MAYDIRDPQEILGSSEKLCRDRIEKPPVIAT